VCRAAAVEDRGGDGEENEAGVDDDEEDLADVGEGLGG